MAGKVKTITTTIEDEVVFMTDPDIQFVSLVKHGANRTPFKVLKHENSKEETGMEKVVQAILVRNDLPEDQIAKALEGMSKKDATNTGSITSYEQCPLSRCNEETLIVVKHDEIDGVFNVLADLAEDQDDKGTLIVEVGKEAVDYATLDNLYTELYAMADIVSGAMRQENAGVEFRKSTIISAIDNFRTFAEVVLNNLGTAEKADLAVKAEDHPTLLYPFIKKEGEGSAKDETGEGETTGDPNTSTEEGETGEGKTAEESTTGAASTGEETTGKSEGAEVVVNAINSAFAKMATGLEEVFGKLNANIEKSMEAVSKSVGEKVNEIKLTTTSSKSETDEQNTTTGKSENPFKGVLFR